MVSRSEFDEEMLIVLLVVFYVRVNIAGIL